MIRTSTLSVFRELGAASASPPAFTTTTATAATRAASFLSKALSISTEPPEERAVRWRFPADDRRQMMLVRVKHGVNVSTLTTFNSKSLITPDLMEEALTHFYNKIESLRLCLRPRHGQLWLADMPRRKLDFQVLSGTDLVEEIYALDRSSYNLHDGPVWKARLIPCPADAPCPIPEVKAGFPYQCHLILSIHHAFNDGITLLSMLEELLRVADSLLEGSAVDTRPVGELRDAVEARREEKRIRKVLESDPHMLLEALRKHAMSKHLPILMEAYGVPNEAKSTTRYQLPVSLDTKMVEKIAAKCRSIGATLNAGFTAALNISMMEVAREGGLERDVYNISVKLPVDSRRLIKSYESFPLGFFNIPFTQCTATPSNAKKHFWQYVKHLDTELRHKLKRNYMCEERVLEALMRPEGVSHEEMYASQQLPNLDYLFSNAYSPKAFQQQCVRNNVQITANSIYTTIHEENVAMALGLLTIRGKTCLQSGYSTKSITKRVADRCQENNIAVLHDISKMVD